MLRVLIAIALLSPSFASCKNSSFPKDGNQIVAAAQITQPAEASRIQCRATRTGSFIDGAICPGDTPETSSCCPTDEGCIQQGPARGQCYSCADEEGDLLCEDASATHGYVCCNSQVEQCGAEKSGCEGK